MVNIILIDVTKETFKNKQSSFMGIQFSSHCVVLTDTSKNIYFPERKIKTYFKFKKKKI